MNGLANRLFDIIAHNWPELLDEKKIKNAILCDGDGNPINIDDKAIATLSKIWPVSLYYYHNETRKECHFVPKPTYATWTQLLEMEIR